MIIALDGPAGTGKSTIAKKLAERLGFAYFDTGAMYRSFAWFCLKENGDEKHLDPIVEKFSFRLETSDKGERRYFVGKEDVTEAIRQPAITAFSSKVAIYPNVRSAMVKIQRAFAEDRNAVFEGRDMGTVVFPDADLKIFLSAREEIRAKRRFDELSAKGEQGLTLETVRKEMLERDRQDIMRHISPLRKAKDAIEVDTSDLKIDEVLSSILKRVPYPRMKWFYWCIIHIARFFFRAFFKLRIYGLEHYPQGKAIIAPNHASNFDPPVVSSACPEEVHFLGKASLFDVPILGWVIRKLNTHPVSQQGSDAAVFRKIIQILERGQKVILFPEGTRTATGQLQPLEKGLAFLAVKARAKILPVYIQGTFEAYGPQRKFPKLTGKITCAFGSPIEWDEVAHLDKKEAAQVMTAKCKAALHLLKDWVEEGCTGTPP